jgi:O-antigen ligase
MLAAGFYPILTLNILRAAAMMLIGFAPIISALAMAASPAFKAALPFSWEHRLVPWSYVGERIREHPIVGHGFDASRSFDATFDTRGFEGLSVVSLHPHNAGLHIWLETGVVGAILAVMAIWCAGHEAINFARGGRARAMAAAGAIAPVILISSVSYGVWQEWWWAALFLTAGVLYLVPRTK